MSLVTESNAEPYMQMLNGYLTLTALQHPVVGDTDVLVPVFPAVYGGYYTGFGAIFTVDDLQNNADGGFATTLAAQFVYGAQLGWMSLGGTTDDPPMGLFDLLMSSAHDAEIDWLRRLALTRARVVEWVTHGRLMRPPPVLSASLTPVPPSSGHSCSPAAQSTLFGHPVAPPCASVGSAAPPYLASSWYLPANETAEASLVVLLAAPSSTVAQNVSLSLSVVDFGFPASAASSQFTVTQLGWDGTDSKAGQFAGGSVRWNAAINGRQVFALLLQKVAFTGRHAREERSSRTHAG